MDRTANTAIAIPFRIEIPPFMTASCLEFQLWLILTNDVEYLNDPHENKPSATEQEIHDLGNFVLNC